ncbi:threonine ammonia-lyase [Pandoraea anhela]|uniref:Serine dehydratase n=1 Tax=Pandoraea anhela TaxID=2508295 RepID=A0A5E4R6M0_9BURK|nr:pyridoxal-phosphate dependent enzyme [Pandoraea anhela]VVD59010.1 serine dehydratase [Pandoraea anhela]
MKDIQEAAGRLSAHAVRTPLLKFQALNEQCNGRVLIKPEMLQRTGSFKFRGAYNKIASLTEDECRRGVMAASSGNHAQGVASSAQIFGLKATILMPEDAPEIKIRRTRDYGADVVLYDRYSEDQASLMQALQARTGAVVIAPFDDPLIMAGQGTVGLEIAQDLAQQDIAIDVALVPCGGGGLIAGVGTAMRASIGKIALYCVEPEHFDDTARSLDLSERVARVSRARDHRWEFPRPTDSD